MRINQNVSAVNAHRNLFNTDMAMNKSLERLSSGLRVNRAADDAAGLAISEKMRGQIRGLKMAQKNALDGVSLIQTAEGSLNEVHSMLQRMRELAVQATNGTNGTDEVAYIQEEVDQLLEEITAIGVRAKFNDTELVNGGTISFQLGANVGDTLTVNLPTLTAPTINHISDDASITTLDTAIDAISNARAELGAVQNRLEHTIASLGVSIENMTAAESRVRDADMAAEMATMTRNQIMMQAGTAMMAQANMKPQSVLQLLG